MTVDAGHRLHSGQSSARKHHPSTRLERQRSHQRSVLLRLAAVARVDLDPLYQAHRPDAREYYTERSIHPAAVSSLLAICRPSDRTVAYGVVIVVVVVVVVVVVDVCNRSHMRTSKCTCSIFGVNMSLDPG